MPFYNVSAVSSDLVADHQPTYTYASSDTSIATVNETTGVITPVSQGTTTITINSAATESYEAATEKTISLTVTGYKVTSNLTNLTTTGSSGVGNSADYTATLTANTGYALPESITVTGANDYTYTSSTGEITISSGDITDDITITASGSLITYTVTFIADGVTVDTQTYTVADTSITEPTVPSKDYYAGEWETYSLTGGDVTVNAVYTQTSNIPQTSLPTDQTVVFDANYADPAPWVPTEPDDIYRYSLVGPEDPSIQVLSGTDSIRMIKEVQGPLFFDAVALVQGDYTLARTYNIFVNNTLTYYNGNSVKIRLQIPEDLQKEGRTFRMFCVTQDGAIISLMDLDNDPTTITFETDKFYAFTLAYVD